MWIYLVRRVEAEFGYQENSLTFQERKKYQINFNFTFNLKDLGMTQVVGCLEWQIAVHWLQVG
jgi:hypothetical protein